MPTKRNFSESELSSLVMGTPTFQQQQKQSKNKKLRRLPHVFSKVLELPLNSEADVSVEESAECFKFVAKDGFVGRVEVRAHMVELHPGVKKVVVVNRNFVCNAGNVGLLLIDEMKLDMWRFRLPANARPEAAKAVCTGGELVVTVPKSGGVGGSGGNIGNLVAVL